MLEAAVITIATLVSAARSQQPEAQRPPPVTDRVLPAIAANDNRAFAGRLAHGVLRIGLVARIGLWYPDEDQTPGITVQAFAEEGRATSIPGPLIRVREGTRIRATVRNAVPGATLILHGLHTRPAPADDTLQVAAGAVREVAFDAGAPGTYFYWATTTTPTSSFEDRWGPDSQLAGALIVDPAGGPSGPDHVFVITGFFADADTTGPVRRDERFQLAINGRSWPHTERLAYGAGDSVRWRWINASGEPHPMHLHGFFFRIDRIGSEGVDTVYAPDRRPLVVTQRMDLASTMMMTWAPERAGNWLMHCHIQAHVAPGMRFPFPDSMAHHARTTGNHALDAMAGLVIGVRVRPGRSGPVAAPLAERRGLRLVAHAISGGLRGRASGFTLTDRRGPAVDGPPSVPGPPIVLVRGEPVRITVVNRLREPTTVHWHGIELESYYDGVAGWSGQDGRRAPLIAPGDSFVANLTPPRAGTFIYHSHMEEGHQRGDGLYGALIVLEPNQTFDPTGDLVFVAGGREIEDSMPPMLNGETAPAPIELESGRRYRIRLVNIMENNGLWFALTDATAPVRWRAIAKDGADLPPAQATERPARQRIAVGETYDFEYTPRSPGELRLGIGRPDRVLVTQVLWVR